MGGRVAQWVAIDHGSRIGALVLGATTAGDERGVPRTTQASADLASGDPHRLARLFFRDEQTRPDAAAFFDLRTSRHIRRLHRQASLGHDAWDELGRITASTLVIHGTDDELVIRFLLRAS
jgi:pimeloyl-ACP methyl ester carboxylesterase